MQVVIQLGLESKELLAYFSHLYTYRFELD